MRPIYANLFDDEGGEGYTLLWSRPRQERRVTLMPLSPIRAARWGFLVSKFDTFKSR